jgi:2-polyprenyl-3-methyl-5-hydroxy-6-metoxy-1,4-benzoquinol methylase
MSEDGLDSALLEHLSQRWANDCQGALVAGLVYLGDVLGLFAALHSGGPATPEELARTTGLTERYVREWLAATTLAEYIVYEPADGRFTLSPEQAACFADPDNAWFSAPEAALALNALQQADSVAQAFKSGGGVPFAAYGDGFIAQMDRANRPRYRAQLVDKWLAAMPGAVESLAAGGSFLDVGCGGGLACLEVLRAFPRATATGLDRHPPSIERARANARAAGLESRARFETTPVGELPMGSRFDVVTTFDVVHDLADPVHVLSGIRQVLGSGGCYLMADGKFNDRLEEGIGQPGARFAAYSVLHCLPQSLADNGAGLGALIGETTKRELARQAGFSTFEALPIADDFMAFYCLRA